jgi:hypothetical protein
MAQNNNLDVIMPLLESENSTITLPILQLTTRLVVTTRHRAKLAQWRPPIPPSRSIPIPYILHLSLSFIVLHSQHIVGSLRHGPRGDLKLLEALLEFLAAFIWDDESTTLTARRWTEFSPADSGSAVDRVLPDDDGDIVPRVMRILSSSNVTTSLRIAAASWYVVGSRGV